MQFTSSCRQQAWRAGRPPEISVLPRILFLSLSQHPAWLDNYTVLQAPAVASLCLTVVGGFQPERVSPAVPGTDLRRLIVRNRAPLHSFQRPHDGMLRCEYP